MLGIDALTIGVLLCVAVGASLALARSFNRSPNVAAVPQDSLKPAPAVPLSAESAPTHAEILSDQIAMPLWRRNADLRLVYVNNAYADMVGAQSTDAVLEGQIELYHHRGTPTPPALATRAAKTGQPQTETVSIVVASQRRVFQVTETPCADGFISGYAEDVSALDEALSDMASHTEAHQNVLEQLQAGIAVFDDERRLRFVNRAYADHWGLDYEWLADGPHLNAILETLRERRRLPEVVDFDAFRRQVDNKFHQLIVPSEQLLHLPDSRCFREVCAPHPLGGLVFVVEDVTDNLALERSYKTLVEVQTGIVDRLADGIAAFGTDGRLTVANPSFERLVRAAGFHVSPGDHWSTVLDGFGALAQSGREWDQFTTAVTAAINSRDTARRRIHWNDGRTIDTTLGPLADGSVILTLRDITDTHNIERILLERNAALEEMSRLKADFFANASYELRTPLTSISGFAEIMLAEIGGPVTEAQREYLDSILNASEALTTLIDSLLDATPHDGSPVDSQNEEISLGPILNSVAEVVRPEAEIKLATLNVESSATLGPIVSDERKLRQLVFNLLNSAVRIGQREAAIIIRCHGDLDQIYLSALLKTTMAPSAVRSLDSDLAITVVRRLSEMHGGSTKIVQLDHDTVEIACTLARYRQEAI